MTSTLAILALAAAAIVLLPLLIAHDLWQRARRRDRRPSVPVATTIAFGLCAVAHNLHFLYRVFAQDGAGVTGLTIVTSLWSVLALGTVWIMLRTQRVRVYRSLHAPPGADAVETPVVAVARSAPPPRSAALPQVLVAPPGTGPDPARDEPCAPPLRATKLPPTIRDLVRSERQSLLSRPSGQPPLRTGTARIESTGPAGSVSAQVAAALTRPSVPAAPQSAPQARPLETEPAIRYSGRTMAQSLRHTTTRPPGGNPLAARLLDDAYPR